MSPTTISVPLIEPVPRLICGIHDKCKHDKWCTFVGTKKLHPEWTDSQVAAEAIKASTRPNDGKLMSLSKDGIAFLTTLITDRFNAKTIDRIAAGGCSNLSENFWSMVTKFSEGKRLCLDLTDAWEVMNKLAFCRKGEGNISKTNDQVAAKLGVSVTGPELKHRAVAERNKLKVQKRQKTEKFKRDRAWAKWTKEVRTGKTVARKAHRSDKVPLTESAKFCTPSPKLKRQGKQQSKRKPSTCSKCKQVGHRIRTCKMPAPQKTRPLKLIEFDLEKMKLFDNLCLKSKRKKKPLPLFDKWI